MGKETTMKGDGGGVTRRDLVFTGVLGLGSVGTNWG